MQKFKTLKGFARRDCRGNPDLCTFTRDITKSGSIEWVYVEIKYPTCDNIALLGVEMIDFNYDLTRVTLGGDVFYKTRKSFISGSTRVYRDGILMTPNNGVTDTYDYTEVANNKIKFDFVFDFDNTNVTIIYDTL